MIRRSLAGLLFAALSCWAQTPASIELLPGDITLSGPQATHQVIVQGRFAGDRERDLTAAAVFEAADPKLISIESGVIRPRVNGRTQLTASVSGATSSIEVTVEGFEAPVVPSFLNDVQPVLTKAGCNSGACHGSEAGKNGFKLSLRGYDSEFDHAVLTREAGGRRVARWDPSKSLLLLKPTLTIPHNGGKRFAVDSPDFRILADWIANGAPPPADDDVTIEDLRVYPEQAWLENDAEQQVIVQAVYSDGSRRDVTRWAKFSSTNSGVATVDDLGRVKMQGPGEAAITVWYSSKVKFARVGIPFGHDIDPTVYSEAPRTNYIDDLVIEKLQALHIAPSEPVGDTAFLRRAYLDAMGALPSPAEVERFEADPSPDKRKRLIDAIIEREEFVDYWAYKWSDLLLVSSRDLGDTAMWSYYRWVRESVEKNTPWDRLVRQLLTSTGNSSVKGELNYYQLHRNIIELAENVTQAFLGLRITCARCHNHPLEKWTQNDYYQFANLMSRVAQKNGTGTGDVVVYRNPTGGINHPKLGKPLPPRPLDGEELALDSAKDRRRHLAEWLTSADNPYFARAIVNKVWANFMGRGIVDPVDDMRASNPPSNEKLLSALTKDFVEHKFDVKHLVRRIMLSATYQRSSKANDTNVDDEIYYSRYIVRRLPAEVVLDAVSQVTRVPTRFSGYPEGTRALQLPDTQVNSFFLTVFGRPPRINVDAAEREHAPTIKQALHVINGDTLNNMLRDEEGAIEMFLKLGLSNAKILDYLYLSALSRYPTEGEKAALLRVLDEAEQETRDDPLERDPRRKPLEDLMWAMLTGKEFLFNH